MNPRIRSSEAFKVAKQYIPGGVNSPVRAFRGVGGEPFFVDTWGPAILGHAPKAVIEAVRSAAGHGMSFGIPNPYEIEMARTICEWIPSIEKVRMVNSGTEATMSCIRLARGFTKRDKIVKFEGCYHGHVDSLLVKAGSGALTHGEPDSAGIPAAFADLTITLPFNDEEALKAVFAREKIAAVILEPIPANAGLFFAKPGFHELLRKLCTESGTVLIFDEVMTGFRVAKGGAQELYGIRPDLTALGKIIGGGLPVGAFGGRAEIMDYLSPDGPVYQAGTLSGNPLAMAAGLAQLRQLEAQNGWARLETLGAILEESVRATLNTIGRNYQFHRVGSMFCLFFCESEVYDLATAQNSDRAAFGKYFHACLDAGVYFAPSQFETGFISLAHQEADLEATARVTAAALKGL